MTACPHCESTRLSVERYSDTLLLSPVKVQLERWRCMDCGGECIDEGQIARNHQRIAEARKAAP